MNRKLIYSFILSLIVFSSYSQLLYPEQTDFIEIEPEIEKLKKEGKLYYEFPIAEICFIDSAYIDVLLSIDPVYLKKSFYNFKRETFSRKFETYEFKFQFPIEKISELYERKELFEKEIIENLLGHNKNYYSIAKFVYSDRLNKAYLLISENGYAGYRLSLVDKTVLVIDLVEQIIE
jgi:hypothetical protein